MSINNPIISAGPSIRKTDTGTTICTLIEATGGPPFVAGPVFARVTYEPQWHGQMIFVNNVETSSVSIFVAYYDGLDLSWKGVNAGGVITDPRTGKPKDPYYDLY